MAFAPAELKQQVDLVLSKLPPQTNGAFVAVASTKGVKIIVAKKFEHDWYLAGELIKDWAGPLEAQVSVVKTW